MGVPKFFRYISERYPCLSEFCLEDKIPQFDNLYLDMNGIIHNCSHPDDGNVHFRITEEAIFRDIFRYIDKLFYLIQPQKLFFMAVDGVAPRAKMNQQRGRRFRSAKDAELLEEKAQKRGEKLPDEARFDSNCITPGTEFMVRLQTALQYFVKYKITTNPIWRKCRIILSGHETPGEGEHKIMEYIRYLKLQPDYDPNTRHCLYGLDADLIILGLCTHELHFSLLREEVKFGRKAKPTSLEDTRFFLLHLGLLREYLELEFFSLTTKINDFDIEKLIDDWILMGFLVGNDFIPHLPNLHIATNALPSLYKAYMHIRPELGGYMNECGHLNLERLEKYFDVLSVFEKQHFEEIMGDLKYFQAKISSNNDKNDIKNSTLDEDLAKLVEDSEFLLGDDSDDNMTEEQLQAKEFIAFKHNYYIEKLKYDKITPEVIEEQTECYVRALQWILHYYYRGVPSWEWFYPHHYAPFVSDLKNFRHLKIEFELGKPFLPFEQLLAVLPAASKDLLPIPFRGLMTNSDSELIEFYPKDFKTDLNGKKQEWEAVVLIPFIDEKKLLKAMTSYSHKLSKSERDRNKHGPMLIYDYSKTSQGSCDGLLKFKPLKNVLCTEKKIWRDDIAVPDYYNESNIMPRKTALKNVYFPGFPTMKHIKYTGELIMARVKVFEQPSRNESMILIPECRNDASDIHVVAKKFLNQEVYICWPHLIQAKVIAVSTIDRRININMEETKQDPRIYDLNKKTIIDHHMIRMGIDFQDLTVLVHVLPSAGTEYVFSAYGKMTLKKSWSKFEVVYPAQGIVKDIATYNPQQSMLHERVEDIFPANSSIFMLGEPYIGSEGKVIDPKLVKITGRIKVNLTVLSEPDFTEAKNIQKDMERQYMNSFDASTLIGIQSNCLARITGSIFVIDGIRRNDLPDNTPKINIGLQLKFPKNNEEVTGYMRKNGNIWLYSQKAVNLVRSYYDHFPRIFELISGYNTRDIYFESDLFPDQVGKNRLKDLTDWLKSLEHHKAERVPCGTKVLEKETVEIVLKAIDELKNAPVKCVTLQVKPHLIMKPGLKVPESAKTRKRPLNLFDRFVVVKNTYQIPVGNKGTIVAVYPFINQNSVRYENVKDVVYFYDVLFDKTLPDGAALYGLGENRFFKICENSILEIFTEDKRKIEQKPIINNLHLNENVVQSAPPLPIVGNLNSLKKFSDSDARKSNGSYANQLLNAILKKNQINDNNNNSGNLSIENNDNNKIKTNDKETINKPKEENSQFDAESQFVKKPPPPPLTQPLTREEMNEQYQQQKRQELQQMNLPVPSWATTIPKPFECISKNEFLKPPENQKKYLHDNFKLQKKSLKDIEQQQQQQQHKNLEGTSNVNKFMDALSRMDGSKKDVDDPSHSTNVLRQILGINPTTNTNTTTTTSETSTKNACSIKDDNNKTFRHIPIKNLPQPPPNWRAETSIPNWRAETSINKNAAENRMTTTKSQQKSINSTAVVSSTTSNTAATPGTGTAPPLLKNRQPPRPQSSEIYFKNTPHAFNSRNYTGPVAPPVATTSSMMHMFHYQNYHHSHPHSMLDYNNMQKQQSHNNDYRNQPYPPPPMTTNQYNNSPPVTSSYQMKVSNIDITKEKGAFIPLQALKQAKKLQESQKIQNPQNHHHHNYGNGNHPINSNNGNGNRNNSKQSITKMMNENDKTMIPECSSSSSNSSRNVPATSSNKNPEFTTVKQQQSFTPKRYPTPKIAAKFDKDFISN